MKMKKKSIISVMAIAIAIITGATAYAASTNGTASAPLRERLGLGRITSMRGYDFVTSILKDKLGLTDADLTEAQEEGKTLYQLAVEKGMTEEQFKTYLLEEKSKAIDEAVGKGTITKEEADVLKERMNANIQNCPGNFGQNQGAFRGQGRGRGCGTRGMGQRGFNN